jgi:hypothetical protein
MAERTDQRTRESDVDLGEDFDVGEDFDAGLDETVAAEESSGGVRDRIPGAGSSERQGLRGRLADRFGGWFSVRTFTFVLLTAVVLSFLTGWLVPVVPASSLIGVFAAGFLFGAVGDRSHYLEVAAATLLSGAVTAVLGNLLVSLAGAGVELMALGATASGLAGLVGHYVGRDLRDGLTREV